MQIRSLGQEDPLEEEMATHSSILAWRIPRTEEPGGLQSKEVTKSQTELSVHTQLANVDVLFTLINPPAKVL